MKSSFFDLDNRYFQLSHSGDLLERLNDTIDWEIFRPILSKIDQKVRKSNVGRKETDRFLMFKILILQHLYNSSDEQLEYQINDRLSFMRFLNLGLSKKVPDKKIAWAFREQLKKPPTS